MIISVSLIIPITSDISNCKIESYLFNEISKIYIDYTIQIVYLVNKKNPNTDFHSEIINEKISRIIVGSDRYFGACEENIYRIQDIGLILNDYIYIIGDHDEINFNLFFQNINKMLINDIDIMGVNPNHIQSNNGNITTNLSTLSYFTDYITDANLIVERLFKGETLAGKVGMLAMFETYGMIDWAAFIGSHIYKKEHFLKILQYQFCEYLYSFPYMQALYASEANFNYAISTECFSARVSDDYINPALNNNKLGWLTEHRMVRGFSHCIWSVNFSHLASIENPSLFSILLFSSNISQRVNSDRKLYYTRSNFLNLLLHWGINIFQFHIQKSSHYYKDTFCNNSLVELRYFYLFLRKIIAFSAIKEDYINNSIIEIIKLLKNILTESLDSNSINMSVNLTEDLIQKVSAINAVEYKNSFHASINNLK